MNVVSPAILKIRSWRCVGSASVGPPFGVTIDDNTVALNILVILRGWVRRAWVYIVQMRLLGHVGVVEVGTEGLCWLSED